MLEDLKFHSKAREGKEKVVFNKYSDSPYVHIVRYNRQDKKQMVGIVFHNIHEVLGQSNYVKYSIHSNRIYFEFTNKKDIHAFKLTFTGSYTVDDVKAVESNRHPRKIQLDTDADLLEFCGNDYALFYDSANKLYYIENNKTTQKLF